MCYSMEPSRVTATIPVNDYKKIRMSILNAIRHRTTEKIVINRPDINPNLEKWCSRTRQIWVVFLTVLPKYSATLMVNYTGLV